MTDLKEYLFIGTIAITSLFNSGCRLDLPTNPDNPGEFSGTFQDMYDINCTIEYNNPEETLIINESKHHIFQEANNNPNNATRKYFDRKVKVTGIVTDIWPNEVWIEIGDEEESVYIELKDEIEEDELKSWKHKEKTFSGNIFLIESHAITIDKAVKEI